MGKSKMTKGSYFRVPPKTDNLGLPSWVLHREVWKRLKKWWVVVKKGSVSAFDENDSLVELNLIEQLVKLSVLLFLVDLDVVLLEAVQSKLCLINVDFKRVLHDLLADGSDLERSGQHQFWWADKGVGREPHSNELFQMY
jgi:hypothetical protein